DVTGDKVPPCRRLGIDPVAALATALEGADDEVVVLGLVVGVGLGPDGCGCASELDTTSARASARRSGSFRPRFADRRKIPAAALGVKKDFRGPGWVSKTSDKQYTLAPLGDPEVLSVQHSPRHAIPEVIQGLDDFVEVGAPVD